MFKNLKYKIFNIIHKKRNIKLHKIESYLKSLDLDVTLFKNQRIIEFNKQNINSNIYKSTHYKYKFDGETLTFYHNIHDECKWLSDYISSELVSHKVNQAFQKTIYEHFSHSGNQIINNCVKLPITRESVFIIKVTNDALKMYIDFIVERMDGIKFYIEVMLSPSDDQVIINYAPNGSEIDKSIESFSNPVEELKHQLTSEYMIHFLTDYAKLELLNLSETNEYNSDTHGELIKMFYY